MKYKAVKASIIQHKVPLQVHTKCFVNPKREMTDNSAYVGWSQTGKEAAISIGNTTADGKPSSTEEEQKEFKIHLGRMPASSVFTFVKCHYPTT